VNLPFPAGTAGDAYRLAFDDVVAPLAEEFAPGWLLISAGFDAHRADPLTDLGLTAGDFAGPVLSGGAFRAAWTAHRLSRRRLRPHVARPLRRCVRGCARGSRLPFPRPPRRARRQNMRATSLPRPVDTIGLRSRDEQQTSLSMVVPERLRPILEATRPIVERFQARASEIYLVGGPVRDGIAGRPGGVEPGLDVDIDLTTDATPDEIESLVSDLSDAMWNQGKRFGTNWAHARRTPCSDHDSQGGSLRCRLPQAEVQFGSDIESDLSAQGLHRERGWRSACRTSCWSIRSTASPISRRGGAAHPARTRGVVSDDPLRMLRAAPVHRRIRTEARR